MLHEVSRHRPYLLAHSPTLIAPSETWLATRSLFKVANFICLHDVRLIQGASFAVLGKREEKRLKRERKVFRVFCQGVYKTFTLGLAFALAFAFALRYPLLCALSLRFYFLRLRCRLCAALVRFCRWQRPKPAPSLCFLCKVIVILL
jgi:hypothetical protein